MRKKTDNEIFKSEEFKIVIAISFIILVTLYT